jgi:hypothetical protein
VESFPCALYISLVFLYRKYTVSCTNDRTSTTYAQAGCGVALDSGRLLVQMARLGFGRIVASEMEVPSMVVHMA